ncbi:MAG: DUF4412 domain-containing protein [Bacteroidota bacterium]
MYIKNIIPTFLIFTLLVGFSTISFSQNSNFEGRVKVNSEHEGNKHVVEYFLKGEKLRMETDQTQKMVVISDKEDMIVLMPQNQTYMEFPKEQVEQMQKMMGNGQKSDSKNLIDEDMKLEKTGETKDILGRECEKWVYEDNDKKVETWAARGFSNFMGFKSPMEGGNPDAWKGLFGDPDLFPMKMTQWDKDGNETYKFEVTEMEEESLSEDLFAAPSDYEKMNMMGM